MYNQYDEARKNQSQEIDESNRQDELACVVVVVALAMFYALFVMMIGGFV